MLGMSPGGDLLLLMALGDASSKLVCLEVKGSHMLQP